jgi:hypothetical protein
MAVVLLSKAAYARHRGCDEKAVRKAIAEKRISTIDGKIDPAVADIQWAQNTRARADSKRGAGSNVAGEGQGSLAADAAADTPAKPSAPVEPGYSDIRTRREAVELERAERENAKEAGRLIDRDTTERAVFDAFRSLRDALMAAGQRAAPRLIGLSDARDIEMVITEEQRKAFAGWEVRMLERLSTKEGR